MKTPFTHQVKILPLVFGLVTWFAIPMAAMADKLPDYNSAAGMLKVGKEP